jgi:hypothetical protein
MATPINATSKAWGDHGFTRSQYSERSSTVCFPPNQFVGAELTPEWCSSAIGGTGTTLEAGRFCCTAQEVNPEISRGPMPVGDDRTTRENRALDAANFFLADVRDGLGPISQSIS